MPGLKGDQLAKELLQIQETTNKILHITLISADFVSEAEDLVDLQLIKPIDLTQFTLGTQFATLKFLKSVDLMHQLDDEELIKLLYNSTIVNFDK